MHKFLIDIALLAAGGIATSAAEYKLNYNLVDKIVDLFRSAEAKLLRLKAKSEQATTDLKNALVKKIP